MHTTRTVDNEAPTAEQQLQTIEQDMILYLGGDRLREIGAVHPLPLVERLNMVFRSYAQRSKVSGSPVERHRHYIT